MAFVEEQLRHSLRRYSPVDWVYMLASHQNITILPKPDTGTFVLTFDVIDYNPHHYTFPADLTNAEEFQTAWEAIHAGVSRVADSKGKVEEEGADLRDAIDEVLGLNLTLQRNHWSQFSSEARFAYFVEQLEQAVRSYSIEKVCEDDEY
jgi:hypothetical protein